MLIGRDRARGERERATVVFLFSASKRCWRLVLALFIHVTSTHTQLVSGAVEDGIELYRDGTVRTEYFLAYIASTASSVFKRG